VTYLVRAALHIQSQREFRLLADAGVDIVAVIAVARFGTDSAECEHARLTGGHRARAGVGEAARDAALGTRGVPAGPRGIAQLAEIEIVVTAARVRGVRIHERDGPREQDGGGAMHEPHLSRRRRARSVPLDRSRPGPWQKP